MQCGTGLCLLGYPSFVHHLPLFRIYPAVLPGPVQRDVPRQRHQNLQGGVDEVLEDCIATGVSSGAGVDMHHYCVCTKHDFGCTFVVAELKTCPFSGGIVMQCLCRNVEIKTGRVDRVYKLLY